MRRRHHGCSGPIRGLARLEPFSKPPCGINVGRKAVARTCRELLNEGCSPGELRVDWGFSATEMSRAGLRAWELIEAGVTTREVAGCGWYKPAELHQAGCSALDLLGSGRYSVTSIARAGFGPRDFVAAGVHPSAMSSLGFSQEQCLQVGVTADGAGAHMLPPPSSTRSSRRGTGPRPQSAGGRQARGYNSTERPRTAAS